MTTADHKAPVQVDERIAKRRMWWYVAFGVLVAILLMFIGVMRLPSVHPAPSPEIREAVQ